MLFFRTLIRMQTHIHFVISLLIVHAPTSIFTIFPLWTFEFILILFCYFQAMIISEWQCDFIVRCLLAFAWMSLSSALIDSVFCSQNFLCSLLTLSVRNARDVHVYSLAKLYSNWIHIITIERISNSEDSWWDEWIFYCAILSFEVNVIFVLFLSLVYVF